jgi:hypothetical protein
VIPAGAKPPSLAPLTAGFGIGTIPVAAAALTQSLFGTFKELKDFALSDMTASDHWPAVPSGYGYHSLSMPLGRSISQIAVNAEDTWDKAVVTYYVGIWLVRDWRTLTLDQHYYPVVRRWLELAQDG